LRDCCELSFKCDEVSERACALKFDLRRALGIRGFEACRVTASQNLDGRFGVLELLPEDGDALAVA